jgi:SAM-dependent methyltransferase
MGANEAERDYVLGDAPEELRRLTVQAAIFAPSTRELYAAAGIGAGCRVLDAGCGVGDGTFLAADLVGPSGCVVGVDQSRPAVGTARHRAALDRRTNVEFRVGDLHTIAAAEPFDAVVGRQVLLYQAHPAETLRYLAGLVRPGGVMAFQEMDWAARSSAPAPLLEACLRWHEAAFRARGIPLHLGLQLFELFVAAGLPAPRLRYDGMIGGGAGWSGYRWAAGSIRTVLPLIEQSGAATREEVAIDTLEDRLRAEVVASGGVVCPLALVGAWSRLEG